jgi:hypothetical protein
MSSANILGVKKPKNGRISNGILTYEDCSDAIDKEIRKRRGKWLYNHIEWDDVAQTIRAKIALRWGYWDQTRPLAPYVNRIITRHLQNLVRDSYAKLTKPCVKCAGNEGENFCRFTASKTQCAQCPLYAEWQKSKESAFNVSLPVSIENHVDEVRNIQNDFFDLDYGKEQLIKLMKKELTPVQYKVFIWLFIENRDELYVAQKMNLKTSEENRCPGYRTIKNYKDEIQRRAKKVLAENDIF